MNRSNTLHNAAADHRTEEDIFIAKAVEVAKQALKQYETGELTEEDLKAWTSPAMNISTFVTIASLVESLEQLHLRVKDLQDQQQGLMHLLAQHEVLPVIDHDELDQMSREILH